MRDGRRSGRFAVGGLVALVAASSGCKWLPVRHADRDRKVDATVAEVKPVDADLPELPPMRTIDDDEAFRPAAPTPLLDAASSRDAALKKALALSVEGEAAVVPGPPPSIVVPPAEAPKAEAPKPDPPKADRLVRKPARLRPPGRA